MLVSKDDFRILGLQTTRHWASTSAKVYLNRNNRNRRLYRFYHFLLKVQFPGDAFSLVTGGNPMIPAWLWTKEHDSLTFLVPPSVRGNGGYHLAPSCTPWSHAHLNSTIEFTWAFQLISLLDRSSPAKWHSKEYYLTFKILKIKKQKFKFMYFGLCWVFVAVCRFSLVAGSQSCSLWCTGFSCWHATLRRALFSGLIYRFWVSSRIHTVWVVTAVLRNQRSCDLDVGFQALLGSMSALDDAVWAKNGLKVQ